jgi:putative CocE/NonD family hydrolase
LTFRTGVNTWERHDAWPPKSTTARPLYFHPDGKLSFTAPPSGTDAFDSYVSDPANPVPYRQRPITLRVGWTTWQVEDQRFVHQRPDVLTWSTETLTEDVVVSGRILAKLFASTSGTDSDWIVKLIDVYPEKYEPDPTMGGYQLMIAGDVVRGRYRKGFERAEPLTAGAVLSYEVPFPANDHVFRKGHRIMVQVQSTWFPVIDRNPQTFVRNIFNAKDSDFQKATQRIYRSGSQASHVLLPIMKNP